MSNPSFSLPDKLLRDLRHSRPEHAATLRTLIERIKERHPRTEIRPTQRYTALYIDGAPFVYLDPQRDRILLGFFRDFADRLDKAPSIRRVSFPEWNRSKGGLVGYAIEGRAAMLPDVLDELQRLTEES